MHDMMCVLILNAAHQPTRSEASVCGENLPIQISEVFGGTVSALATIISSFYLFFCYSSPASSCLP